MVETAFCSQCGQQMGAGSTFCGRCGAPATGFWGDEPSDHGLLHDPLGDDWAAVRRRLEKATLGQYQVRDQLGLGGMAAVFLAQQLSLNRRVAIKVMRPSLMQSGAGDESLVTRFMLEAQTVGALEHRNIVRMVEIRQEPGLYFFVMQYIEGRSLDRVLRSTGPLAIPVVRALMSQVMAGLGFAHRHRVIHRDVKPSNIMLDIEGNAIVTDFGIAKVLDPIFTRPNLTRTNQAIGSPVYMSPEQCLATPVTAASDQYSLGAVCYELLTGVPPFEAPGAALLVAHLQEAPRPIRQLRPDCPPGVEAAVLRMLAKRPEDRFPGLADAAVALGARLPDDHDQIWDRLRQLAVATESDPTQVIRGTPGSPVMIERVSRNSVAIRRSEAPTLPLQATPAARQVPGFLRFVLAVTLGLVSIAVLMWQAKERRGGNEGPVAVRPTVIPPVVDRTDSSARVTPMTIESAPALPAPVSEPERQAPALELVPGAINLMPGDRSQLRTQGLAPAARIRWASSATEVATVENGMVTAISPGIARITAGAGDAKVVARVTVTLPPGTQLVLREMQDTLLTGDTLRAWAELLIPGRQRQQVQARWSVETPAIVALNAEGPLLGMHAGRARVHAHHWGLTASATIVVAEPARTERSAPVVSAVPISVPSSRDTAVEEAPASRAGSTVRAACQAALLAQDTVTLSRMLGNASKEQRAVFDRMRSLFRRREWRVKVQLSGSPGPMVENGGQATQEFAFRLDYRDSFGSGRTMKVLYQVMAGREGTSGCWPVREL